MTTQMLGTAQVRGDLLLEGFFPMALVMGTYSYAGRQGFDSPDSPIVCRSDLELPRFR